jgi:hypothetical protein
MSARRFAFFAASAFLLMFVAANVIGNSWFRSWRLDLDILVRTVRMMVTGHGLYKGETGGWDGADR